jgi:heterodisulfide reductase subunit A2
VPQVVVIDPERCLQFKTGKCKQTCVEACADRHAIDFNLKRRRRPRDQGRHHHPRHRLQAFDAARIPQYGYGVSQRLYGAGGGAAGERSGPTGGEVVLRDGGASPKPRASSSASARAT